MAIISKKRATATSGCCRWCLCCTQPLSPRQHAGFGCLQGAAGMQSSSAGLKSPEQVFTSASLDWLLLFWLSSVLGRALTFLDRHPGK